MATVADCGRRCGAQRLLRGSCCGARRPRRDLVQAARSAREVVRRPRPPRQASRRVVPSARGVVAPRSVRELLWRGGADCARHGDSGRCGEVVVARWPLLLAVLWRPRPPREALRRAAPSARRRAATAFSAMPCGDRGQCGRCSGAGVYCGRWCGTAVSAGGDVAPRSVREVYRPAVLVGEALRQRRATVRLDGARRCGVARFASPSAATGPRRRGMGQNQDQPDARPRGTSAGNVAPAPGGWLAPWGSSDLADTRSLAGGWTARCAVGGCGNHGVRLRGNCGLPCVQVASCPRGS